MTITLNFCEHTDANEVSVPLIPKLELHLESLHLPEELKEKLFLLLREGAEGGWEEGFELTTTNPQQPWIFIKKYDPSYEQVEGANSQPRTDGLTILRVYHLALEKLRRFNPEWQINVEGLQYLQGVFATHQRVFTETQMVPPPELRDLDQLILELNKPKPATSSDTKLPLPLDLQQRTPSPPPKKSIIDCLLSPFVWFWHLIRSLCCCFSRA